MRISGVYELETIPHERLFYYDPSHWELRVSFFTRWAHNVRETEMYINQFECKNYRQLYKTHISVMNHKSCYHKLRRLYCDPIWEKKKKKKNKWNHQTNVKYKKKHAVNWCPTLPIWELGRRTTITIKFKYGSRAVARSKIASFCMTDRMNDRAKSFPAVRCANGGKDKWYVLVCITRDIRWRSRDGDSFEFPTH